MKSTKRFFISRHGEVKKITPRFCQMLEQQFDGKSLDLDGDVIKRPDYACMAGQLVIEIKSLETAPKERIANAMAPFSEANDWPKFFGAWPLSSILDNLPNEKAQKLNDRVTDRLGRAIRTHLRKAQDQLSSYVLDHDEVEFSLVVLINEGHHEYHPQTVEKTVSKELSRKSGKGPQKYNSVDAVLYLTETHAWVSNGQATFPILTIQSRRGKKKTA